MQEVSFGGKVHSREREYSNKYEGAVYDGLGLGSEEEEVLEVWGK